MCDCENLKENLNGWDGFLIEWEFIWNVSIYISTVGS